MKYFVTDCKFRTEKFFQHAVISKFLGLTFPVQSTQLSYELKKKLKIHLVSSLCVYTLVDYSIVAAHHPRRKII